MPASTHRPDWIHESDGVHTLSVDNHHQLIVHRYVGYPKDQWLASFRPFFEMKELKQKDLEKAKLEALHEMLAYAAIFHSSVEAVRLYWRIPPLEP